MLAAVPAAEKPSPQALAPFGQDASEPEAKGVRYVLEAHGRPTSALGAADHERHEERQHEAVGKAGHHMIAGVLPPDGVMLGKASARHHEETHDKRHSDDEAHCAQHLEEESHGDEGQRKADELEAHGALWRQALCRNAYTHQQIACLAAIGACIAHAGHADHIAIVGVGRNVYHGLAGRKDAAGALASMARIRHHFAGALALRALHAHSAKAHAAKDCREIDVDRAFAMAGGAHLGVLGLFRASAMADVADYVAVVGDAAASACRSGLAIQFDVIDDVCAGAGIIGSGPAALGAKASKPPKPPKGMPP